VNSQRSEDRVHDAGKASVLPVIFLILNGFAAAQVPPSGNGLAENDFRLSVDVDLVVLPATVRDRLGQSVSDLVKGDFEVYEDNTL